jgi:hypothetical protein
VEVEVGADGHASASPSGAAAAAPPAGAGGEETKCKVMDNVCRFEANSGEETLSNVTVSTVVFIFISIAEAKARQFTG